MSELTDLFPQKLTVHGIGLLPVRFCDLDTMLSLYPGVKLFIQCQSDQLTVMMWGDILFFISIACRVDLEKLKCLENDQVIDVMEAAINLNNEALEFKKEKKKTKNSESFSWFSAFNLLTKNGFSVAEISDMTLQQVKKHIEAIQQKQQSHYLTQLMLMRAAQADDNGFKSVVSSLSPSKTAKRERKSGARRCL